MTSLQVPLDGVLLLEVEDDVAHDERRLLVVLHHVDLDVHRRGHKRFIELRYIFLQ